MKPMPYESTYGSASNPKFSKAQTDPSLRSELVKIGQKFRKSAISLNFYGKTTDFDVENLHLG